MRERIVTRATGYIRASKILEYLASVDDSCSEPDNGSASANPWYKSKMEDRTYQSTALIDREDASAAADLDDWHDHRENGSSPPKPQLGRSSKRGLSPIYLDEEDAKHIPPDRFASALTRRPRRRIVFGWYGGKFSHLEWLLPLLPEAHHYCEPFSGSAAVLLNRTPSPVETYNDVDGDVVNFFAVLRDQSERLAQAIALTPFSREEFYKAIAAPLPTLPRKEQALERARRFYIRARQARTGLAQTATLGRWANCRDTSRAGMSGVISRWLGGVEALPDIATRLLRVQIENRPAADVIRLYDGKDTLFYCDPPYLHDTRGDSKAYGFEMDEAAHVDLAAVLRNCKGKVALSGYRNKLMDKLYRGWRRYDADPKHCHSIKKIRQECVWMNY